MSAPEHRDPPDASPQALVGFMSNDEWADLLAHVDALIAEMDALPPGQTRDRVFELLAGVDGIHREALTRLVRLFKPGVLHKVVTDPPIHTLMELYDLLPAAHASEIPVEVAPARALGASPPGLHPHWVPLPDDVGSLAAGEAREIDVDGRRVLLCRVERDFFAFDSACAADDGPLAGATLERFTLACPRHAGCFYDVRQGTRIGASGRLRCHATRVDDAGRLHVGIDVPFTPDLPPL